LSEFGGLGFVSQGTSGTGWEHNAALTADLNFADHRSKCKKILEAAAKRAHGRASPAPFDFMPSLGLRKALLTNRVALTDIPSSRSPPVQFC
jgi:hypothetical protein